MQGLQTGLDLVDGTRAGVGESDEGSSAPLDNGPSEVRKWEPGIPPNPAVQQNMTYLRA